MHLAALSDKLLRPDLVLRKILWHSSLAVRHVNLECGISCLSVQHIFHLLSMMLVIALVLWSLLLIASTVHEWGRVSTRRLALMRGMMLPRFSVLRRQGFQREMVGQDRVNTRLSGSELLLVG